ncbi:YciI family protein [Planctomycetales bacterium ZRK34]|nr:YciI family protein [Planctomycetales bacterium ZRK34]
MRFIVFVKANQDTEAGVMPSQQLLEDMMHYNQQLVDAGIMKGGEGLRPSRDGARVVFDGQKQTVVDGPFTETKELVAGYWLWECESLEEAIDWVKKCPNPTGDQSVIEIRPMYVMDDFGEAVSPKVREMEDHLCKQIESQD